MEAESTPRPYVRTGVYVRTKTGLRERDRRVERLARKLADVLPLSVSDRPSVKAWAQLELLANEIYFALRKMSLVNSEGGCPRLVDDYRKIRMTQLAFAREIGLTPAARLALNASGRERPFDLVEALVAVGKSGALEAAELVAEQAKNGAPDDKTPGQSDEQGDGE